MIPVKYLHLKTTSTTSSTSSAHFYLILSQKRLISATSDTSVNLDW